MVALYYRLSPDVARCIADREGLRILARAIFTPIVFIVAYPWEAVLLFSALAVMLFAVLRLR